MSLVIALGVILTVTILITFTIWARRDKLTWPQAVLAGVLGAVITATVYLGSFTVFWVLFSSFLIL